jgi:hypothetical protein
MLPYVPTLLAENREPGTRNGWRSLRGPGDGDVNARLLGGVDAL